MKFSVFTASTPDWTPAETVKHLAGQGWDGVEWRVTDQEQADPPGFWAGNRSTWPLTGLEDHLAEIARTTRDAGLEFSGIGAYVRVHDHPNAERVLAATAALGAGRARLTMPQLGESGETYPALFARTRADLEWATGIAAGLGVKILVELHHGTIVSSASAAIRLVDGLDPAAVGVIHDTGNLVIEGHEDYLAAFQMLGEYLAHVHVKNVAWSPGSPAADGSVPWTQDWAPMAEGQADLTAYFRALTTAGYDGWVTAEDFSTAVALPERTAGNLHYLRNLRASTAARQDI